ncbi:MAG: hypothetical protein GF320_21905 [Armatimonadia bacterium]|nr:hypothetical protein [Armatimonadia bacterium]
MPVAYLPLKGTSRFTAREGEALLRLVAAIEDGHGELGWPPAGSDDSEVCHDLRAIRRIRQKVHKGLGVLRDRGNVSVQCGEQHG